MHLHDVVLPRRRLDQRGEDGSLRTDVVVVAAIAVDGKPGRGEVLSLDRRGQFGLGLGSNTVSREARL